MIPRGTQAHTLVSGGEKPCTPQSRIEGLPSKSTVDRGMKHDKAGEIFIHAPKAVRQPGSGTWAAWQLAASLNVGDGWIVIDRLRVDCFYHSQIIHHPRGVRQKLTHPGAMLTMLTEFERGWSNRKSLLPGGHRRNSLAIPHRIG